MEPVEVYSDNVVLLDNGITATLLYKLTPPVVGPSVPDTVVTVRMSMPLLKLHVFMANRYLVERERQGHEQHVGMALLNQNGIGLEDWRAFWGQAERRDSS